MKTYNKLLIILLLLILWSAAGHSQNKYGSEIMFNTALPSGPNAKYYKIGFGINGNFYYDIEENIRVGLGIGYIRIPANSEEINKHYESIVSEGELAASGSVRALPLVISFRLISPPNPIRIYGLIEGGLWTYWIKVSGTFTNNGSEVIIDKSEFRNEAGFALGMGALFGLNETLSLDINAKYQFVQNSEYLNVNYNSISTSQMIVFGVGLNWNFEIK